MPDFASALEVQSLLTQRSQIKIDLFFSPPRSLFLLKALVCVYIASYSRCTCLCLCHTGLKAILQVFGHSLATWRKIFVLTSCFLTLLPDLEKLSGHLAYPRSPLTIASPNLTYILIFLPSPHPLKSKTKNYLTQGIR